MKACRFRYVGKSREIVRQQRFGWRCRAYAKTTGTGISLLKPTGRHRYLSQGKVS
jgi:hypothetical protein